MRLLPARWVRKGRREGEAVNVSYGRSPSAPAQTELMMVTLLVVMLLLILLFGGLGIFVAKVFLLGLLIALVVGAIGGMSGLRRA